MSEEALDGKGKGKMPMIMDDEGKVAKEKKLTTPFNLIFHQSKR
jgi:hypothetical protein